MRSPRVLISYDPVDDARVAQVLALARRLRLDGLDAWMDRFEPTPAEGWDRWMLQQMQDADILLVVRHEGRDRSSPGLEALGPGFGAPWSGRPELPILGGEERGHQRVIEVVLEGVRLPGDDTIPGRSRYYVLDCDYPELLATLRRSAQQVEVVSDALERSAGVQREPGQALEAALAGLLARLFTSEELRQYVAESSATRRLVAELPGSVVSLSKLAFDTAELLARHGLVGAALFADLARTRPGLAPDIQRVATRWGVWPIGAEASGAALESASGRLLAQVERAIDDARATLLDQVVRAALAGRYVAIQAPVGFGLSRTLRRLTERLRAQPDTAALFLSPFPGAGDVQRWFEHVGFLFRRLGLSVPAGPTADFWPLFGALKNYALESPPRRLVVVLDDFESFPEAHRKGYVELLNYLARLWEDRLNACPEFQRISVVMGGSQGVDHILAGQVPGVANVLSQFRADPRMILGPVAAPAGAGLADLSAATGGHPGLLLWAAGRGGSLDGRPEEELGWLRDELRRLSTGAGRAALESLLAGSPWSGLHPLRWSGLVDPYAPERGWLGPVLREVARRALGGGR